MFNTTSWLKMPACPENKGSQLVQTQFGEEVAFHAVNHHRLCEEFIVSQKPFSFRRWFLWSVVLNCLGYFCNLHTQDSRIMTACLFVVLLALMMKLHLKVHKESILVSSTVGVQMTTTFMSGRQISRFYDRDSIQDILINEGITMYQVLFYITLVLRDEKMPKLIPLYTHCWPSLACLKQIYQGCQRLLHFHHRKVS